jgi:U4/U6.U5 tri-snRNP-associated protein 2
VSDSSLNDIKHVVKPTFSAADISSLDRHFSYSLDLYGKKFVPGFIGLNNIKQNDYINVVVHALAHVKPLRDHFLVTDLSRKYSELAERFGSLVRKIWNSKAFKNHVSPHEFVQEVSRASGKQFSIGKQSDPIAFLSWFLNNLHSGMGGTRKMGSSIIHKIFQGRLLVESQSVVAIGRSGEADRFSEAGGFTKDTTPFLFLTLEPPQAPLFASDEKNAIPQIPLEDLLSKFNGKDTFVSALFNLQEVNGMLKRYSIAELPEYLLLCIKRFTKNNFTSEKNPTIINFPVKNMDMSPCTCF